MLLQAYVQQQPAMHYRASFNTADMIDTHVTTAEMVGVRSMLLTGGFVPEELVQGSL